VVQAVLPYKQLMTPHWIHKHSTIIGPHALYPHYFEILPTTGPEDIHALQLQLVPPSILATTDSVTVTMTIAVDTTLADSAEHDVSFGIGDGTRFVGFHVVGKNNYHTLSPCYLAEGDNIDGILKNPRVVPAPLVASRRYSSEIKLQFRPAERWGSCHTEHDEGYTNIASFQRLLDVTKGMYLEVYRGSAHEKYRIKYIKVEVDID